MAYSNYEGKAFRNGEHHHEGCDGSVQQDRLRVDMEVWSEPRAFMYHALMGEGPVRVGLLKTSPLLLIQHGDLFMPYPLDGTDEVEIHGAVWRAYGHSVGNHATATLVEPDGTVWTGMAGYEAWESWCGEVEA